jgi:hypothetical protein
MKNGLFCPWYAEAAIFVEFGVKSMTPGIDHHTLVPHISQIKVDSFLDLILSHTCFHSKLKLAERTPCHFVTARFS